jgi:hypothetical protein
VIIEAARIPVRTPVESAAIAIAIAAEPAA